MSRILVYSFEGLIGDSLCTLPAIQSFCRINKNVSVWIENKLVRDIAIFDDDVIILNTKPNKLDYDVVFETRVDLLFGKFVCTHHMIQAHYTEFGFDIPTHVERPKVKVSTSDIMSVDFIVSPYSASGPHNKLFKNKRFCCDCWCFI